MPPRACPGGGDLAQAGTVNTAPPPAVDQPSRCRPPPPPGCVCTIAPFLGRHATILWDGCCSRLWCSQTDIDPVYRTVTARWACLNKGEDGLASADDVEGSVPCCLWLRCRHGTPARRVVSDISTAPPPPLVCAPLQACCTARRNSRRAPRTALRALCCAWTMQQAEAGGWGLSCVLDRR